MLTVGHILLLTYSQKYAAQLTDGRLGGRKGDSDGLYALRQRTTKTMVTKRPSQPPCSRIVVCVVTQGRVCDSSRKVAAAGAGVGPGVVRSVSVRLEESASSAGAVEPARGPPHLQQPLLCAAELGRPQVTYTLCILQVNKG